MATTDYRYQPVSTTYKPLVGTTIAPPKPPAYYLPVSTTYHPQVGTVPIGASAGGATGAGAGATVGAPKLPTLPQADPWGLIPRGSPAPPPGGSTGGYSYQIDPAILAMFNLQSKQRRGARDAQERDLLMKSGLWQIAQKMFGGDASWVETVKNNPFSDMANIRNLYEGRLGKINQANEDLNAQNLFFSSTRTNDVLPSIYRQRGQDEYGVETGTRDAIQRIEEAFNQAELQDKMSLAQAQLSGALSAAQTYPYGTGGGNGAAAPTAFDPFNFASMTGAPAGGTASTSGIGAGTTYGQGSSGWKVGDGPTISGQAPVERSYAAANGMVYAPRYAKQPDWQPYNGNYYRDSQGNIFTGSGRLVSTA